jgi:hypothetical protein
MVGVVCTKEEFEKISNDAERAAIRNNSIAALSEMKRLLDEKVENLHNKIDPDRNSGSLEAMFDDVKEMVSSKILKDEVKLLSLLTDKDINDEYAMILIARFTQDKLTGALEAFKEEK